MNLKEVRKNKEAANNLRFGLDLEKVALHLVLFLNEVSHLPDLFDEEVLRYSIHCYEQYWLPFAAKHGGTNVVPPLYIEWIWTVHMLSHLEYSKYCKETFKVVVDHAVLSPADRKEKLNKTRELWVKEKAGDLVNWDAPCVPAGVNLEKISSLAHVLESAVEEQRIFNYQVPLPHYQDPSFLEFAVINYRRLVLLQKLKPKEFLLPGCDADLVWHAHLLHPVKYGEDSRKILGKVIDHHTAVDPKTADGEVGSYQKSTRKLWLATYGEEHLVSGGVYRGDPKDQNAVVTSRHILPVPWKSTVVLKEIEVEGHSMVAGKTSALVKRPDGLEEVKLGQPFILSQRDTLEIQVKTTLRKRSGKLSWLSGRTSYTSTPMLWSFSALHYQGTHEKTFSTSLLATGTDHGLEDLVRVKCIMEMKSSIATFHAPFGVEAARAAFQEVPTGSGSSGYPIQRACFRLSNDLGSGCIDCRIDHQLNPLKSSVQISNLEGEVLATSELIRAHELPHSSKVKKKETCPTLDAEEMAMLIRGHKGDWGILKARWGGYHHRKGLSGLSLKSVISQKWRALGPVGSLKATFFPLTGFTLRDKIRTPISFSKEGSCLKIPPVHIDIDGGKITVSDRNAAPELLALAMSVAVLHVLTQPRTLSGIQSMSTSVLPGANSILLLMAGYSVPGVDEDVATTVCTPTAPELPSVPPGDTKAGKSGTQELQVHACSPGGGSC